MTEFRNYYGTDPGWGTDARRALFKAACKYLGINPTQAENIFGVGFHSILQSSSVQLSGEILNKVKKDPAILNKQREIVAEIKKDNDYKVKIIRNREIKSFGIQLGGQRARGEMWKQALEFWKWRTEYSATWEMAFDELTWAVRSVNVKYSYVADSNGDITISYNLADTLDLRPSWGNRSMEYNAICCVLGFMYHDVLGGSDELQIKANWKTIIK
ncbi:hypothetical protein IUY40_13160 [Flavobacterium sp. ALJ2]|uniref:hypothetical protein n=1 Tax=Flavobacterium sp. ALJ2 TaxID=2786960 RepID=UPI00189E48A3|nr:hypothetical protein [Flavobacterium sp. ALJ2]MBF7092482.1 hypothetical protein [Flavobacterium sp. ALJ2]